MSNAQSSPVQSLILLRAWLYWTPGLIANPKFYPYWMITLRFHLRTTSYMSYVFIDLCSSKNMFSISTFINIYRAFLENIYLYVVDVLFSVYWSYWSRLSSFTEHQGTSVPQNLKGFLLIKRLIDTKYFFQTPSAHSYRNWFL